MIDQSFPPGPPAVMGPMMGPCIRGPLPPPPPGPPGPWIHEVSFLECIENKMREFMIVAVL